MLDNHREFLMGSNYKVVEQVTAFILKNARHKPKKHEFLKITVVLSTVLTRYERTFFLVESMKVLTEVDAWIHDYATHDADRGEMLKISVDLVTIFETALPAGMVV